MLNSILTRPSMRILLLGILLGLGLRAFFVISFVGNYDQMSYQIVADIIQNGGNVYAETHRYNYSPVWMYVLHGTNSLALFLGIPFHVSVRTLLVIVELLVVALMASIFYLRKPDSVYRKTLIYYLNPGVIFIIGYHGQFEILAILPIILLLFLNLKNRGNIWLTLLLSSIATLLKHNVMFVLWSLLLYFLGFRRALIVSLVSVLTLLLSLVLYILTQGWSSGIINNVLMYTGVNYQFGLSWLLPGIFQVPLMLAVVGGVPLILLWINPKIEFFYYWLICLLAGLSVISGFSIQYMLFFFIIASFSNISYWAWAIGIVTALSEIGYMLNNADLIRTSIFTLGVMCLLCLVYLLVRGSSLSRVNDG